MQKEQTKLIKEKILNEKVDRFNNGDTPNKIFFQNYKTVIKRKAISSLRDDEGVVKRDLPDILNVAHNFFQKLFKRKVVDDHVIDSFLQNIPTIDHDDPFVRNLMALITLEELENIIFSFKNCKAPGIDGLGIEFYKMTFNVIKNELLDVLNVMLRERFIPRKIKTGLIKLIHKGGDECDIETYRPITLLNLDYKILSKIIDERLKPILDKVLHNSQYAKKSSSIKNMNNLIRDITDDMQDQSVDSFLLQVDFCKAFDSISHEFLNICLKKMGFPDTFIQMLYAFDKNATSKLLINGHLSKIIKLECGARQGDPLGMDKFIIVLNVLLVCIDSGSLIVPYRASTNKCFLTAAFADDVYSFVNSLSSLLRILYHVKKFKSASGLSMNTRKTKGMFFDKSHVHNISMLPLSPTNWNQPMEILGVPYGDPNWQLSFWKDICKEIGSDLNVYKVVGGTLDAKAIISKTKVLPKISYIASTRAVPTEIKIKIDHMLLNYIVPHRKTYLKIGDFAAPRNKGGYDIDDVNMHASLFLLSGLLKYIQKIIQGQALDNSDFFIEYNIGWQICKYLGVPINLACPHRSRPNKIYGEILEIIRVNKIPADLLIEGKIKSIYKYVVSKDYTGGLYPKYIRLHDSVLPNYLKTFNFNVHYNLLPVKRLFRDYALDNDSRCNFCDLHPDTHSHIFSQCKKLDFLWKFLDEVLRVLNVCSGDFSFTQARRLYDYDMVNSRFPKADEKYIIYLNSVVNHNIWRYSKKIQHENILFDQAQLIKNVVRSLIARKSMDDRLKSCSRIDNLEALCNAASFVQNVFSQTLMVNNNGR